MGRTALVLTACCSHGFSCREISRQLCASNALFLLPTSCACARRSLPAVKAPCEKLLSAVHASTLPRCCVNAIPIQLSSCVGGRGCCRGLRPYAFFLRRCLSSAEPDQLPPGAPWKV